MKLTNEDACTFCQSHPETLIHLFNDCEIIKQFWQQLQSYITNKCNLIVYDWTITDILFGNTKLDIVINCYKEFFLTLTHHYYNVVL